MEWYYYLGAISYGLFILQTILSCIGIDTDLDVDFDMDGDVDVFGSDIISFKGLIHFAMGFSGWLMLTKSTSFLNVIAAVFVGILFMLILYVIVKLFMRLSQENVAVEGNELVGSKVRIIFKTNKNVTTTDGTLVSIYDGYIRGMEVKCISEDESSLTIGSYYTIKAYVNGFYVVS